MLARPLSFVVLGLCLALVALGGVVHTTGSSLACPDWPLCNGEWMPRMSGGVLYEHGHRLLALLVATGVVALAAAVPRERPALRRLGLVAVGLVVVQALLGAATVLLRLPPPVSIAHLFTATVLVGVVFSIALALLAPPPLAAGPGLVRATDRTLVALFLQIGLGAGLRHLGAAPVCGTDPLLCGDAQDLTHPAILLTFAHRGLGVLVLVLVVALAVGVHGDARADARTRAAVSAVVGVALAQVTLGVAAVMLALPIAAVTLHLVGAEILFLALLGVRLGATAGARAALRTAHAPGEGLVSTPGAA